MREFKSSFLQSHAGKLILNDQSMSGPGGITSGEKGSNKGQGCDTNKKLPQKLSMAASAWTHWLLPQLNNIFSLEEGQSKKTALMVFGKTLVTHSDASALLLLTPAENKPDWPT